MKRFIILITFLMMILSLTGCGNTADNHVKEDKGIKIENINVENYFVEGPNIEYFTKVPHRVLCIGANQTDTLMDLGVGNDIVCSVKYEDNDVYPIKAYHQAAFKKLHFISRYDVTIERVLELHPDLIVCEQSWFSKNKLGSTMYWNKIGVPTMVCLNTTSPSKEADPETITKEMNFIKDLGLIFHKEKKADTIVNDTMNRIAYINEKTKNMKKPKVLILDLLSTTVCYGKNKIAGDICSSIGGIVPVTTASINDEYIIKYNPDVVFVIFYGKGDPKHDDRVQKLLHNPAFQHLNFAKNGAVYGLPLKYAYTPMVRTIDSVDLMAMDMYPGVFDFPKEYHF